MSLYFSPAAINEQQRTRDMLAAIEEWRHASDDERARCRRDALPMLRRDRLAKWKRRREFAEFCAARAADRRAALLASRHSIMECRASIARLMPCAETRELMTRLGEMADELWVEMEGINEHA